MSLEKKPSPKIDSRPPKFSQVIDRMATEWDDLINDLATLNGFRNKDQEYKDLCASTALTNLWAIVEMGMKPTGKNLEVLRGLMKEHDKEYYKSVVVPYVKKKYEAEKERLVKEAEELKKAAAAEKERIEKETKILKEAAKTSAATAKEQMDHLKHKQLECQVGIFRVDLTDKCCECSLFQGCDICKKFHARQNTASTTPR